MIKQHNILLGISGGISAYKACMLASTLSKENDVRVMMTDSAQKFITPLTFRTLTKNNVITDTFSGNDPAVIPHISLTQQWCDIFVIAPATANIIGKTATGIADDILSTSIIAATAPVLFIPAMNKHMYRNIIVQDNIQKLKQYGYEFMDPDDGLLACGASGEGRFPDTECIMNKIHEILESVYGKEGRNQ